MRGVNGRSGFRGKSAVRQAREQAPVTVPLAGMCSNMDQESCALGKPGIFFLSCLCLQSTPYTFCGHKECKEEPNAKAALLLGNSRILAPPMETKEYPCHSGGRNKTFLTCRCNLRLMDVTRRIWGFRSCQFLRLFNPRLELFLKTGSPFD